MESAFHERDSLKAELERAGSGIGNQRRSFRRRMFKTVQTYVDFHIMLALKIKLVQFGHGGVNSLP